MRFEWVKYLRPHGEPLLFRSRDFERDTPAAAYSAVLAAMFHAALPVRITPLPLAAFPLLQAILGTSVQRRLIRRISHARGASGRKNQAGDHDIKSMRHLLFSSVPDTFTFRSLAEKSSEAF